MLAVVWAVDTPVEEAAARSATRSYHPCFHLTAALMTACSAARLATLLGIVPRAMLEAEEAATEVEDTVEEDMVEEVMVEGEAVEEAEVCSRSTFECTPLSLFHSAFCLTLLPTIFRSNMLLLRRLRPHVP